MDNKTEGKSIFKNSTTTYNEESFLSLMNIYQNEWTHQDTVLWNHAFAYFVFIFTIIVFPIICPWQIKPEVILVFPMRLFPWVGIALAFALLFVMLGYKARMECSAGKYREMIKMLDDTIKEKELQSKNGEAVYKDRILGTNLTRVIAIVMFLVLIITACFVLYYIPQIKEIYIANSCL